MGEDNKVQSIFDTLTTQRFYDWYMGKFDDWISGEENAPTKEEILKDIKQLFHV